MLLFLDDLTDLVVSLRGWYVLPLVRLEIFHGLLELLCFGSSLCLLLPQLLDVVLLVLFEFLDLDQLPSLRLEHTQQVLPLTLLALLSFLRLLLHLHEQPLPTAAPALLLTLVHS